MRKLEPFQLFSTFNAAFPDVDFNEPSSTPEQKEEAFNRFKENQKYYTELANKGKEYQKAFETLFDGCNIQHGRMIAVAFARQMSITHRTIQNDFFRVMMASMYFFSQYIKENGFFDMRNKPIVEVEEDFKKFLEKFNMDIL